MAPAPPDLVQTRRRATACLHKIAVCAAGATLCACTGHTAPPPPGRTVTDVRTLTTTRTIGPPAPPTMPVSTTPTTWTAARSCPWLSERAAADRVGLRLARITVQRSGGRVVGCRFYALQHSPLHNSEHLPGPHQPAVEITTVRYPSDAAAHNAFVRLARRGSNVQRTRIGTGAVGLCFQTAFYPPDRGRDWACAVNIDSSLLVVSTVVVTPALNAVEVARRVASAMR